MRIIPIQNEKRIGFPTLFEKLTWVAGINIDIVSFSQSKTIRSVQLS